MTRQPARALQRGVTLVEALVALLVMSIGMVALVGLMSNLRQSTDIAKQRSEAMRIAQAELGQLRTFSVLTRPTGALPSIHDYDTDLASAPAFVATTPDSNASFTVSRTVTPLVAGDNALLLARTASVTVSWADRAGSAEQLTLDTIVARVDPAYGGALAIPAPAADVRIPGGQHPAIPATAKDLGNKSSAFRPSSLSSTVWVFNNISGVITGACTIAPGTPVSSLTAQDVESCSNNTYGYLISGQIRYSNTNPANPTGPEGTAVSTGVTGIKGGSMADAIPNPTCFVDDIVTGSPSPSFLNYSCIVYPSIDTAKRWTGQVLLSSPLPIGTATSQYRVCRYSADYNGNATIDNAEHPAVYTNLANSLARQNFLVIRGNVSCPAAPAIDLNAGVFADYSTLQLQPSP